ncbi:MAG: peptidase domain-containing ABC transporter [Hyphomicrobiales bacterium]
MKKFTYYKQLDQKDCGPTCLRMIAKYYGKTYTLPTLREKCYINREGVSLLGISEAAESIGFRTLGARISLKQLVEEDIYPTILHWNQNHFVVLYDVKKKKGQYIFYVADPGFGLIKYTIEEFKRFWVGKTENENPKGIALILEPTPAFYQEKDESIDRKNFSFLLKYLKPHKRFFLQLILGMATGSLLQLILPFLTQAVVDVGITTGDLDFITLILIAQLVLFISTTSVEFIRGWLLLHISTRINISLISDFLIKLMRLPLGFFDSKMIGDIMQRIGDHQRIESFLTSSSLSVLFSMINLIVFGVVLAIYDLTIFGVFLLGSALYTLWVLIFLKKRRELDFKRFARLSENQSNLFQLITGMQEIKLNNCEIRKRWEWEKIQAALFKVNIKGLGLSQYQEAGGMVFNQGKNILITFIAARAVVEGEMTLGMMMAVQYILGQLNSPIQQMIGFVREMQDAKISLERLGEIHDKEDEENQEDIKQDFLPEEKSISIDNISFQYEGPHSPMVLENLNLEIPEKKVTAIVGTSGSGKTTLIKLMLGFYQPTDGEIKIESTPINSIKSKIWRESCGAVMQDGFIFSDTIAQNIAPGEENVDNKKLAHAIRIANIKDYIDRLPLGVKTKIGQEGSGLSQGQKQRILIARAVYKNPNLIFFDEATNALDANNERQIMKNLDEFFFGRTVIVVAHRLSTVKNADQIVVLEKGKIIEIGDHKKLTEKRGAYYELVKNQLELGN